MPILEAKFPVSRHWFHNEEQIDLLKSNGFRWSAKKACWWRLVGEEGEALAAELREKFITVVLL